MGDDGLVNIAILGTGGMGGGHIDSFMRFAKKGEEKVQIVAVCDVNTVRRKVAEDKVNNSQGGAVAVYTDYREMLETR